MKYLVCGANGTIGLSLYLYLKSLDLEVKSADVTGKVDYSLDFTNVEEIERFFSQNSFEVVFNCIGSYSGNFARDLSLNVQVSENILHSINKQTRVVLIGSSAEYGIPLYSPVDEKHPLNPVNIYGLTKSMQTLLFKYYSISKSNDIVLVRIFNILSSKLSPSLFIGNIYAQIKEYKNNNRKKISLGYLENYRDYIILDDAIKTLFFISKNGASGEVYNLGSGKKIRIKELVVQILTEENIQFKILEDVVDYKKISDRFEVESIVADISKLNMLKEKYETN